MSLPSYICICMYIFLVMSPLLTVYNTSLFVYLFERDHINQGKCWQSPLGRKRVSRSEKYNLRIWKEYEQKLV